MTKVLKENAVQYLPYLADYAYQKRVWADGNAQVGDLSLSFVESCCMLFDDTGLGDALSAGETVFNQAADDALRDLSDATDKVDYRNKSDRAIIDTPQMQQVRAKAAWALQLLG